MVLLCLDGLAGGTELYYLDVESPKTMESIELKPSAGS
jgi:hypothetical protein